ncbi:MAG: DNA replication/repair protein RecF [Candidatus Limnocylindria bacterium]
MTLHLEEFRSYAAAEVAPGPAVTVLVGPNGAGKTNVLEALHVLARGDSPRSRDDSEMVRWGAAMARVVATVERGDDRRRVEIQLFAPVPGERRRPRRYLLDGAAKRADDALGEIVVVAFFPEDVDLLTEAPGARRRYLDAMIAQVERRHRGAVREYQRVLEQRNALLRALRDQPGEGDAAPGPPGTDELEFWDRELCRLAAAVSLRRIQAVRELRAAFQDAALRQSGEHGVDVAYASPAEGDTEDERAASYSRLLEEKREKERWQGATLVGPHREDLAVTSSGRDLPSFASRGEQRSVVLALKLAEASWLRERTGSVPVFLLDDVLSELDPERRERLVASLPLDAQAFVTSALPAGLPAALRERAAVIPVSRGKVG